MDRRQLILGPFHGKVACQIITIGKGACGKVAEEGKTLLLADIKEFPDHIACDGDSKSEIVTPIKVGTEVGRSSVDWKLLALTNRISRWSQSSTSIAQTCKDLIPQTKTGWSDWRKYFVTVVTGKICFLQYRRSRPISCSYLNYGDNNLAQGNRCLMQDLG